MTLVLAMSAPSAICMSVDYRVTNRNDGAVLDPFAVKSLVITRWNRAAARLDGAPVEPTQQQNREL
jgi:hypothetical protein